MSEQQRFNEGSLFGRIVDLVDLGPRRTGSAAGRAAAEYVAAAFRSAGLEEVRLDEADSSSWDADRWGLTVGSLQVDAYPVTHSGLPDEALGRFDMDGFTGRIVDMESTPADADISGAIVLFDVRFPGTDVAAVLSEHFTAEQLSGTKLGELVAALPDGKLSDPYNSTLPSQVAEAINRGAVAFIGVLTDYFDSNRYINEDYGDLEIPGLWVTKAQAASIRATVATEPDAPTTFTLVGARTKVTALSPIGILPGKSADTILVHSHHDSISDGAVEDASGTAVVIALAEHFAALPLEQRERTLMFATMDTHFTGYESHQKFVADYVHAQPAGRRLLVDVAIEHIAREARIHGPELVVLEEPAPRVILTNTGPEVVELIDDATADLPVMAVLPTELAPGGALPTDSDFNHRAGLPVISLISAPMYLYDRLDTLDKIQRDQLVPVADAFARIIEGLDTLPANDIPRPDAVAPPQE